MDEQTFKTLLELEFDDNYQPDELLKILPLEYHEAAWTSQKRHQQNIIDGTTYVTECAVEDASKIFNHNSRVLVIQVMQTIITQAEEKYWFLNSETFFPIYADVFINYCDKFLRQACYSAQLEYENSFDTHIGEEIRLVCMPDEQREAEFERKLEALKRQYKIDPFATSTEEDT